MTRSREDLSVWLAQERRPCQTVPVGRPSSGPNSLMALWSRADTTTTADAAASPVAVEEQSIDTWLAPAVTAITSSQPPPTSSLAVEPCRDFAAWLAPAVAATTYSQIAASPSSPAVGTRGTAATWLAPAATASYCNQASATSSPTVGTRDTAAALWLAPAAAATSAVERIPYNLMANWSWQQPESIPRCSSQLSSSNLDLAGLTLADQQPATLPALHQDWLASSQRDSVASSCSRVSEPAAPRRRCSSRFASGSEGSEIMILDAADENIDFPEDHDF